jgi:hypothetical protein
MTDPGGILMGRAKLERAFTALGDRLAGQSATSSPPQLDPQASHQAFAVDSVRSKVAEPGEPKSTR